MATTSSTTIPTTTSTSTTNNMTGIYLVSDDEQEIANSNDSNASSKIRPKLSKFSSRAKVS